MVSRWYSVEGILHRGRALEGVGGHLLLELQTHLLCFSDKTDESGRLCKCGFTIEPREIRF